MITSIAIVFSVAGESELSGILIPSDDQPMIRSVIQAVKQAQSKIGYDFVTTYNLGRLCVGDVAIAFAFDREYKVNVATFDTLDEAKAYAAHMPREMDFVSVQCVEGYGLITKILESHKSVSEGIAEIIERGDAATC